MTKYAVQYESSSKGPLDIETLHDLQLLNSYRKLRAKADDAAALGAEVPESWTAQLEAMVSEMSERNLDPQWKDGREPAPPAEERP